MNERVSGENDFWDDAVRAAQVLAVAPHAIGGIWVRSWPGGAFEHWLKLLWACTGNSKSFLRIPLNADDARLLGGLDLASTLGAGRPIFDRGLLAEADGNIVILPNAECARATTIAALASVLDSGKLSIERDGVSGLVHSRPGVIALDEGGDVPAPALQDRLAIILDFGDVRAPSGGNTEFDQAAVARARTAFRDVAVSDVSIEAIASTCHVFGVASIRAACHAIKVARISAALSARPQVESSDLAFAVRMVLAPRATQLPAEEEAEIDPAEGDPLDSEQEADAETLSADQKPLEDMLVAAVASALPPHVMDALRLEPRTNRRQSGSGRSGSKQKARTHGRRLGARRGDPRRGSPLDIIETMRAAAPWQTLRRREIAGYTAQLDTMLKPRRIEVRAGDFRVRTFKNKRETSTIFVVDASGSAALHRLAEAKGAIELLLAGCYARRDSVALVSFRGKSANVMLPPTRSLTRVKRQVAALPGGGGTPLAAATDCAAALAASEYRRGRTPSVVILTDGKANIDRKGTASRSGAMADALSAAKAIKAAQFRAIVIDTSPRPGTESNRFAAGMGAKYLALPYAGAHQLSLAVKQAK